MPIKYKEDTVAKDRTTGKVTTKRHYVKNIHSPELIEQYSKCRTPKLKAKFRNELVKRHIDVTNV